MRGGYRRPFALFLAVALTLALAVPMMAQGKKAEQAGGTAAKAVDTVRYSGNVVMVSKGNSSLTIQSRTNKYQIFYDSNTKFTMGKKLMKVGDLKEGSRVICLVNATNKDKLLAVRIDIRPGK